MFEDKLERLDTNVMDSPATDAMKKGLIVGGKGRNAGGVGVGLGNITKPTI